jgi:hypothetical protein
VGLVGLVRRPIVTDNGLLGQEVLLGRCVQLMPGNSGH